MLSPSTLTNVVPSTVVLWASDEMIYACDASSNFGLKSDIASASRVLQDDVTVARTRHCEPAVNGVKTRWTC